MACSKIVVFPRSRGLITMSLRCPTVREHYAAHETCTWPRPFEARVGGAPLLLCPVLMSKSYTSEVLQRERFTTVEKDLRALRHEPVPPVATETIFPPGKSSLSPRKKRLVVGGKPSTPSLLQTIPATDTTDGAPKHMFTDCLKQVTRG